MLLYWERLTLEEGPRDTFLESRFRMAPAGLIFRLKNEIEEHLKVWRYHHYNSGQTYTSKRATMLATLQKVHQIIGK